MKTRKTNKGPNGNTPKGDAMDDNTPNGDMTNGNSPDENRTRPTSGPIYATLRKKSSLWLLFLGAWLDTDNWLTRLLWIHLEVVNVQALKNDRKQQMGDSNSPNVSFIKGEILMEHSPCCCLRNVDAINQLCFTHRRQIMKILDANTGDAENIILSLNLVNSSFTHEAKVTISYGVTIKGTLAGSPADSPSGLRLPQPLISGDDLAQKLDAVVLGMREVHRDMREGLTGFNTRVVSVQRKVASLEDRIQALEYMASQQEYRNTDIDGGDGEADNYGDDSQADIFADE
ncbi:hypothetical protein BS47DRAFT_1429995 [Hydnum rufescens UP504]|uniref:Uncharacterized protein n=1 Tax=Hydnum rufescens UP504 TaxID=1448309 RepID=A0A9P6AHQ4_9AGAM|nr:hypothetical protein BS47DRAFT_1429995 [Hydnum rufescens UP504]